MNKEPSIYDVQRKTSLIGDVKMQRGKAVKDPENKADADIIYVGQ